MKEKIICVILAKHNSTGLPKKNRRLFFGKPLIYYTIKAVKESIAQIFTLLGFFIAWLTLTGSAKDTVGIAIIVSTALWLLTIGLREE